MNILKNGSAPPPPPPPPPHTHTTSRGWELCKLSSCSGSEPHPYKVNRLDEILDKKVNTIKIFKILKQCEKKKKNTNTVSSTNKYENIKVI